MKNLIGLIFCLGLVSPRLYASDVETRIKELFAAYPQNQTAQLSFGSLIQLPLYYPQDEGLALAGLIPLKNAQALMTGTGLYPAPIVGDYTFAEVFMNNADSSVGKYQEFMVLVAATSNPNLAKSNLSNRTHMKVKLLNALFPTTKDRHARDQDEFFFYLPWITTTSQTALLAGRELWNMPKYIGEFQLSLSGLNKTAVMKSEKCGLSLGLDHNRRGLRLPLYMDINFVGIWDQSTTEFVKSPFLAKGEMYVSFFQKHDYFQPDPQTDCGKWFAAASFHPLLWQYLSRAGAVLFSKQSLPKAQRKILASKKFVEESNDKIETTEVLELTDQLYPGLIKATNNGE